MADSSSAVDDVLGGLSGVGLRYSTVVPRVQTLLEKPPTQGMEVGSLESVVSALRLLAMREAQKPHVDTARLQCLLNLIDQIGALQKQKSAAQQQERVSAAATPSIGDGMRSSVVICCSFGEQSESGSDSDTETDEATTVVVAPLEGVFSEAARTPSEQAPDQESFECLVCLRAKLPAVEGYQMVECKHINCKECVGAYLSANIRAGCTHDELQCLAPSCQVSVGVPHKHALAPRERERERGRKSDPSITISSQRNIYLSISPRSIWVVSFR
jgi:hypothetical protein